MALDLQSILAMLPPPPQHRGMLFKQSRKIKKWRERYTVLLEPHLCTYKDDSAKEETEKIHLANYDEMKDMPSSKDDQFNFCIISEQIDTDNVNSNFPTFNFYCTDETDYKMWTHLISQTIHRIKAIKAIKCKDWYNAKSHLLQCALNANHDPECELLFYKAGIRLDYHGSDAEQSSIHTSLMQMYAKKLRLFIDQVEAMGTSMKMRYHEMELIYGAMLKLKPDASEIRADYGTFALYYLNDVEKALQYLTQSNKERNGEYVHNHLHLAEAYRIKGSMHSAKLHIENALKLDPNSEQAKATLARIETGKDKALPVTPYKKKVNNNEDEKQSSMADERWAKNLRGVIFKDWIVTNGLRKLESKFNDADVTDIRQLLHIDGIAINNIFVNPADRRMVLTRLDLFRQKKGAFENWIKTDLNLTNTVIWDRFETCGLLTPDLFKKHIRGFKNLKRTLKLTTNGAESQCEQIWNAFQHTYVNIPAPPTIPGPPSNGGMSPHSNGGASPYAQMDIPPPPPS